MGNKLELGFLEEVKDGTYQKPIEKILHSFGEEIVENVREYFSYIVTTISEQVGINEASLFILIPELGYDYRIISLANNVSGSVRVSFYSLSTNQVESQDVEISSGWAEVEAQVSIYLNGGLARAAFESLISRAQMKRKTETQY